MSKRQPIPYTEVHAYKKTLGYMNKENTLIDAFFADELGEI